MKVAILSYEFAEYCIQQANGLARGCEVLLLLPDSSARDCDSCVSPEVDCQTFHKPRLSQPIRQLFNAGKVVRQIRRFRPDVLHFQHGHLWFNLALPWLRSIPLVMTIHDPRHHVGDRDSRKTPQSIMDYGFRRADQVIVHGEALRRQVAEILGIPGGKIHVVPHVALGPETIPRAEEADPPQVLFFGRIWKYKGLEYLIRAQPLISAAFPEAQIVVAGEGEDFESYRKLMTCPDRFVIHNRYVNTAERDKLFRQASIVVLPYIEATQSGVIPLAYSFAKPVVATRTGALCEAVDDGHTGILVPPADPAALATAVIELLGDRTRRLQMGATGREKLDRECSPQRVAAQTLDVYRRAIQFRGASEPLLAPEPCAGGGISALAPRSSLSTHE